MEDNVPSTSESKYDLRSVLAAALPAVGPTRAAVKAMHDVGFKADPKNNDMKELFVGLDLTTGGVGSGVAAVAGDDVAAVGSSSSGLSSVSSESNGLAGEAAGGPSAAQVLLDYRREQKAAQQAAEEEAARLVRTGASAGAGKNAATIPGVGLARAAGVAGLELEEAEEDERHLRKVNLSKTAARLSSKQKRRRKQGKIDGEGYEDRYTGKVLNKSKRKGRMLAMKQMY